MRSQTSLTESEYRNLVWAIENSPSLSVTKHELMDTLISQNPAIEGPITLRIFKILQTDKITAKQICIFGDRHEKVSYCMPNIKNKIHIVDLLEYTLNAYPEKFFDIFIEAGFASKIPDIQEIRQGTNFPKAP
jgi:hypothetical protein